MNVSVRIVALTLASCYSLSALGQTPPAAKRDDLDVTMQIIVDPNAKLPDEVVRRIPLPSQRATATPAPGAKASETKPDAATKGSERAQDARELGKDAASNARERSREAQQQREDARNSTAKDKDREPGPPPDRPNPDRPPRS
jgi:hypothetical protein